MKKFETKRLPGFSLIEVILAVALFSIFSAVAVTFSFQALQAEQRGKEKELATNYAAEGIEIIRAIRDDSFDNLENTDGSGLEFSDGKWQFNGEDDEQSIFRRTISISMVMRDGNEDIIDENGAEDADMKKVTSNVNWKTVSGQDVSISLETYLSRR